MRKVIQLDLLGHRMFGTLHDSSLDPSQPQRTYRTGVLLLSFGQQPRSWVGDLGSSIADRLEKLGYPTFRFDMPGLGDSPGAIPIYLEELWRDILLGAHEPPLHALCENLAHLYSLKELVVGGFCGGAVTALYAINARSPLIKGLILLEPEMALVRTSSTTKSTMPEPLTVDAYQENIDLIKSRITSLYSWRRLISAKADFRFWHTLWFRLFDHAMRKIKSVGKRKKTLPPETNQRMLNSWNLARQLRIPTLVLSVASINRAKYYRAYGLNPGVEHLKSKLSWHQIPNTTHALLTGGAKDLVGMHFENWLKKNYPTQDSGKSLTT